MKMIQFQSKIVPIFPGHFFVIMRIRYEGLKLYKIKADFAITVEMSVFKFGQDLLYLHFAGTPITEFCCEEDRGLVAQGRFSAKDPVELLCCRSPDT